MATSPHLVSQNPFQLTANATPLPFTNNATFAVLAGRTLKISDISVLGDAPAWFWATGSAGVREPLYLAAAGALLFVFETPLVIVSGSTVTFTFDSNSAGTHFEMSVHGELWY